jgi:hypothetical protein
MDECTSPSSAPPESIRCPKESCRFRNIHPEEIIHHIQHTDDHDLSLLTKLEGTKLDGNIPNNVATINKIAKELELKRAIRIVSTRMIPKGYNGILILDVSACESPKITRDSGSSYIRHHYVCTDCNYRSWVYDDTFQHILNNHFEIYVEEEYLKNPDYVKALKTLDQIPWTSSSDSELARKTFIKYNSMNQRYFKKLLPSEPIIIKECDVPMWKNFIGQLPK